MKLTSGSVPPIHPYAPTDLLAVTVGGYRVIMAWTDGDPCALGFRIERAYGKGPSCLFSEIGRTGVEVAVFSDGSVKPRTTYSYRVYSWNASGDSPPSNVAVVTTHPAGTELPSDDE